MLKTLLSAFTLLGQPKPGSKRSADAKRSHALTYNEAHDEAVKRHGLHTSRYYDFMEGWHATHGRGKSKRFLRAKTMRFGLGRRAR